MFGQQCLTNLPSCYPSTNAKISWAIALLKLWSGGQSWPHQHPDRCDGFLSEPILRPYTNPGDEPHPHTQPHPHPHPQGWWWWWCRHTDASKGWRSLFCRDSLLWKAENLMLCNNLKLERTHHRPRINTDTLNHIQNTHIKKCTSAPLTWFHRYVGVALTHVWSESFIFPENAYFGNCPKVLLAKEIQNQMIWQCGNLWKTETPL